MKTRKVVVADSLNSLKEVDVDEDRVQALDAAFRQMPSVFGTAADVQSVLGRRPTARDAAEALSFSIAQLAYTEQQLFERYYEPMQYMDFVPITSEAGPYATSIRYEIEDRVGQAQWADSAATDIPTADVAYAQVSFDVAHGFAGYEYTQQELRETAFLRRPLPERRMKTAMEMYQRKLNTVALLGDTAKGFTGLYNNASVTHATAPSGLAWSVGSGITVAQILNDFNSQMLAVWQASGYNVVPNHVLLPPAAYSYAAVTPASPTIPGVSILQYLKANNLYKERTGGELRIDPGFDLATAGAAGATRAVFYDHSDMTEIFHVPMPLQFLAPQLHGILVKVPGEFRCSGTQIRRVTNFIYADGI